jgi:hypothetical protein
VRNRLAYIFLLALFRASRKQNNEPVAVSPEIDTVAGSKSTRSARDLSIQSIMPPIAEGNSRSSAIAEMERVLRENLSAAERRIQNAVCPIYGCDDRGKPYLIGSSLLLSVGDKLLLVTAAHVLDWNRDTSLYVAGPVKPILIEGDSYRTQPPKAGRDKDLADLGIIDVSNLPRVQWSRYRILTPADLDVDDCPAEHILYGFAGFPVTRNRVYLTTIKLSSMACVVVASPSDAYARLELHPATHFLGNFDRNRQVDSVKGLFTGPDPKGMSGGGVWRLGAPKEFSMGTASERLIGIGIEHRKDDKVLLGVRVSAVVALIGSVYPDVLALLPTPKFLRVIATEVKAL